MNQNLECILYQAARLAEGPSWDVAGERLIWVDILGKSLHSYNHASQTDTVHVFDKLLSAAVPANDGGLMLALNDGLYRYREEDGAIERIVSLEPHLPHNRLNDGKCDPLGRFWVGSMSMEGQPDAGSLYCIQHNLIVNQMEANVWLSNGLGWSPDGTAMYFIDTRKKSVMVYDFDMDKGINTNRRVLLTFSEDDGLPDGMTVDREGNLWIAHWGGSELSCWDPLTGIKLESISIPARFVTSCAFGGPQLDELYITTAKDEETGLEDPYGGSLFRIKPGVKGIPSSRFGEGAL